MFVMYNILLHILTSIPLDLRWQGQPKKAPKGAYFNYGSPRGISKNQQKNLKYHERLKRIPMMTRKNNVAVRELNDNIVIRMW